MRHVAEPVAELVEDQALATLERVRRRDRDGTATGSDVAFLLTEVDRLRSERDQAVDALERVISG